MSRIRTIKPEFWTSEQVMNCSHSARLMFIGLWNFCDDGGVHPASFRQLKAQVFPGDDITLQSVAEWIRELLDNDLLVEFEHDVKLYWYITGWHHQRIEKPSYKYPKYNGKNINSPNGRRTVAERSPNVLLRTGQDSSGQDSSGKDRQTDEGGSGGKLDATAESSNEDSSATRNAEVTPATAETVKPSSTASTASTASSSKPLKPFSFNPSADLRAWATGEGFSDLEIDQETAKLLAWLETNGSLEQVKSWPGSWKGWMRKAIERKQSQAPPAVTPRKTIPASESRLYHPFPGTGTGGSPS